MSADKITWKSEEQVAHRLRDVYRRYGYSCFKMSKFEEYDLYSRNKDFLVSESVITFNDTNGKLMALKPDVTLSIVKSYKGVGVSRLYYNENVYRVSDKTHSYKEILQTGVECLGVLSEYELFEVAGLAALSLTAISERSVLTVSHLGILSAVLSDVRDEAKERIISAVGEKNAHSLVTVCEEYGVRDSTKELLIALTGAYGRADEVADRIAALTDRADVLEATEQLRRVCGRAAAVSGACVRADLSLTGNMNYYNGIVMQGFVEGIPSAVLSGGQYDKLMEKMGKSGSAIGFAVYLDLLERMKETEQYDVDVLLIYSGDDDMEALHERVADLVAQGKSVSVQTSVPERLVWRETEYFKKGK